MTYSKVAPPLSSLLIPPCPVSFHTSVEGQRTKRKAVSLGLLRGGGMIRTAHTTDLSVYYDAFQAYGRKVYCLNKIEILRQFSDRRKQSIMRSAFSNSSKGFVWPLAALAILKHKIKKYVLNSILFIRLNLNLPG